MDRRLGIAPNALRQGECCTLSDTGGSRYDRDDCPRVPTELHQRTSERCRQDSHKLRPALRCKEMRDRLPRLQISLGDVVLGDRGATAGSHLDPSLLTAVSKVCGLTEREANGLRGLVHPPKVGERLLDALGVLNLFEPIQEHLLQVFKFVGVGCEYTAIAEQGPELGRRGDRAGVERRLYGPLPVRAAELDRVVFLADALQ